MTTVVENVTPTPAPVTEPAPPVAEAAPAANPMLEKVLKEKKNAMERVRELESQVQNMADTQLKEKEDWKTLYEGSQTKLNTLNTELESERVEKVRGHKLSALKTELRKIGAQDSTMDALLRLSDIETMKYDSEHKVVLGVEEAAKTIKESLPVAFGTVIAGVDHDAPTGGVTNISLDSFKSMDKKDRRNPDVIKSLYEKHGIVLRD